MAGCSDVGAIQSQDDMKKFEGDHQACKLERGHRALSDLGIEGMTVTEVKGLWATKSHTEILSR